MGKNKQPTYNSPAPPRLQTAQDLFSQGTDWAKAAMPNAFGAREQALQDVNNPNYYAGWQPTSFEQALGNQYFQNVWPDQEAYINNRLSLSGMADSPVAAGTLGAARGRTQFDIGSYLAQQGEQRATNSLNYRNIDPMGLISPYIEAGMNQGNNQANLDYGYAQQNAQSDFQNAMNKYNRQNALQRTLGMVSPIGGAIYGGVTGGGEGFANSLSGTTDMARAILPYLMAGAGGGAGAMAGGLGGMLQQSSPVNPGLSPYRGY